MVKLSLMPYSFPNYTFFKISLSFIIVKLLIKKNLIQKCFLTPSLHQQCFIYLFDSRRSLPSVLLCHLLIDYCLLHSDWLLSPTCCHLLFSFTFVPEVAVRLLRTWCNKTRSLETRGAFFIFVMFLKSSSLP